MTADHDRAPALSPVPLGLVLRVAFATAWAGLLVLVGLWLALAWVDRFPQSAILWCAAGVTLVAMGEFVFAALVAERLFPGAPAAVRLGIEGASALTFVLGLLVVAGLSVGAWSW